MEAFLVIDLSIVVGMGKKRRLSLTLRDDF